MRYRLLLPALLGAVVAPVGAVDFRAQWSVADDSGVRVVGRVYRHGDWLRFEPRGEEGEDRAAAAIIGDLRSRLAWRLDGQGGVSGRASLPPLLLSQDWPIREPARQRCLDPAWRCLELERGDDGAQGLLTWQVRHYDGGAWRQSLLWERAADATVVREQWPQGRSVQLLDESTRTHDGRETLVQHYLTTAADGTRWHSRYWYDPELGQVVREDLPDGSSRWLDGVEIAEQPESLFPLAPFAEPPVFQSRPPPGARVPTVALPPPPGMDPEPDGYNNNAGTSK